MPTSLAATLIVPVTSTAALLALDSEEARLAVNSGEHYLPLLYAAGARLPGDEVALFSDTLDGALSMTSVIYGDAALAPV